MPTRNFAGLLVLLMMTGACGSGSKSKDWNPEQARAQWEPEVMKRVKDTERANKVIDLAVQVEAKNRVLMEEIAKFKRDLMEVNKNYESTREDYGHVFKKFKEEKNQALEEIVEAMFAMREQTSPEEWKKLMR
ncbi:MAG: hypothetical protein IPN19_01495 [Elusimicrobia bacterium]|nr:hypothetical protein [Elusimicrobiota bacterium]